MNKQTLLTIATLTLFSYQQIQAGGKLSIPSIDQDEERLLKEKYVNLLLIARTNNFTEIFSTSRLYNIPLKHRLLCFAVLSDDHEAVGQLLLEDGANQDAMIKDKSLSHIIIERHHEAICDETDCNHLKIGNILFEEIEGRKASVNTRDNLKQTPLHLAIEFGWDDFAFLLLGNDAGINSRDLYGKTPLDRAHKKCFLSGISPDVDVMTQTLVSRGAKTGARIDRENDWDIDFD